MKNFCGKIPFSAPKAGFFCPSVSGGRGTSSKKPLPEGLSGPTFRPIFVSRKVTTSGKATRKNTQKNKLIFPSLVPPNAIWSRLNF